MANDTWPIICCVVGFPIYKTKFDADTIKIMTEREKRTTAHEHFERHKIIIIIRSV